MYLNYYFQNWNLNSNLPSFYSSFYCFFLLELPFPKLSLIRNCKWISVRSAYVSSWSAHDGALQYKWKFSLISESEKYNFVIYLYIVLFDVCIIDSMFYTYFTLGLFLTCFLFSSSLCWPFTITSWSNFLASATVSAFPVRVHGLFSVPSPVGWTWISHWISRLYF